jgi:hypothetical protein
LFALFDCLLCLFGLFVPCFSSVTVFSCIVAPVQRADGDQELAADADGTKPSAFLSLTCRIARGACRCWC